MKRVVLTAVLLGVGILSCMVLLKASSHSQPVYSASYYTPPHQTVAVAPPVATPAPPGTQQEIERVTAQLQQRVQELAQLQALLEGQGFPAAPGNQLRMAEQKQLLMQMINKDREHLEQLQQAVQGVPGSELSSEFGGTSPAMNSSAMMMPGMMGPGDALDPLQQQIRHLQEAAEHLTAAGQEEMARDLRAKAEQLTKELEARRNPQQRQAEQLEQVLGEIRGLRTEVQSLRTELQKLRGQLVQPSPAPGTGPGPVPDVLPPQIDSNDPVPAPQD